MDELQAMRLTSHGLNQFECYLRLLLGQPIENYMGVNNGDDRIKAVQLADVFVHKECLHDRGRISQPGGFDDDSV